MTPLISFRRALVTITGLVVVLGGVGPAAPVAASPVDSLDTRVVARAPSQLRCGEAVIRSPQQGDTLQGQIPIYGSARIDDFNFYKLEYSSADNPETWSAVSSTKPTPIVGGVLDTWQTQAVPDGRYYLKLTVVDSVGQEICRFTIGDLYVANRGTPTPSATTTPEESPTPTATPDVSLEPTEPPEEAENASEAPAEATDTVIEPITPSEESDGGLFSVEGILGALAVDRLLGGFAKGFIAVFGVMLVFAFIAWLRNG